MSLFDNTKIVGWALFLAGILLLIGAIVEIANAATADNGIGENLAFVVSGIGTLLGALVFFGFGNGVRKDSPKKIEVVGKFITTIALMTIITGFFDAIAGIWGVGISTWSGVLSIIIGIIIFWIGSKVNDGKNTAFDKLLWIILVIVFLVMLIVKLMGIGDGGWGNTLSCILMAIVYLFMLVFMFDKDVKKNML